MQKKGSKINHPLFGEIFVPADKSISHRAVMFASLVKGKSIIKNFSKAQDPNSSLEVCRALGVNTEFNGDLIIKSQGKLLPPKTALNCGNSGTTMRLMSGILAGQSFNSVLIGDTSLSSRPMKRIIEPLRLMGAEIKSNEYKAPVEITGKSLHGIDYVSPLASAQVKSCILLAGLNADGRTSFTEPYLSRNHTEIMLKQMGAKIFAEQNKTIIEKSDLAPLNIEICGDISSAAYFIAAALIVPNSKIILKNIGLNPTRCGILEIVRKMGGDVRILDKRTVCGEDVGDIQVTYSELKSCTIEGEIIPRLIDELPVIGVLATQAVGTTIVKDAQDLRNKESDRIKTVVSELKKLGADIEETSDGFIVNEKNSSQRRL